MALTVAGRVASREVKMTELCAEKAAHEPFRASLSFKGGEGAEDDPLRRAALLAVVVALERDGPRRRAA